VAISLILNVCPLKRRPFLVYFKRNFCWLFHLFTYLNMVFEILVTIYFKLSPFQEKCAISIPTLGLVSAIKTKKENLTVNTFSIFFIHLSILLTRTTVLEFLVKFFSFCPLHLFISGTENFLSRNAQKYNKE
jgi:hypothetical protein